MASYSYSSGIKTGTTAKPASTAGTYKGVELNAGRDKKSIDAGLAAQSGVTGAGKDYWTNWDRNAGQRKRTGYENEAKRLFSEQKKSYENANKDTMQDRNNMLGEIAQSKAMSLMNSDRMNSMISNKSEQLRVQSAQIEQNVVQQFASMGKAVNPFIMGQIKQKNALMNSDSVNQFTIGLEKERAQQHGVYLGHLNNVYEQTERSVMDADMVMSMIQQLGESASGVSMGGSGVSMGGSGGGTRIVMSSGGSSGGGRSRSSRSKNAGMTRGLDGKLTKTNRTLSMDTGLQRSSKSGSGTTRGYQNNHAVNSANQRAGGYDSNFKPSKTVGGSRGYGGGSSGSGSSYSSSYRNTTGGTINGKSSW